MLPGASPSPSGICRQGANSSISQASPLRPNGHLRWQAAGQAVGGCQKEAVHAAELLPSCEARAGAAPVHERPQRRFPLTCKTHRQNMSCGQWGDVNRQSKKEPCFRDCTPSCDNESHVRVPYNLPIFRTIWMTHRRAHFRSLLASCHQGGEQEQRCRLKQQHKVRSGMRHLKNAHSSHKGHSHRQLCLPRRPGVGNRGPMAADHCSEGPQYVMPMKMKHAEIEALRGGCVVARTSIVDLLALLRRNMFNVQGALMPG